MKYQDNVIIDDRQGIRISIMPTNKTYKLLREKQEIGLILLQRAVRNIIISGMENLKNRTSNFSP